MEITDTNLDMWDECSNCGKIPNYTIYFTDVFHFNFCKDCFQELRQLEPPKPVVYEYLVIFKLDGLFTFSPVSFKDEEEFKTWAQDKYGFIEFVELYLPSKRVRN